MSFIRSLFRRFEKQCETSENHSDPDLRTKYYKANFQTLFQSIQEISQKSPRFQVVNISKDHGELAIEVPSKEIFLIVTVISVRPFQTAVDINASTEQFNLIGSYYRLKAEIQNFYEKVNEAHTYIGAGKHGIR